MPTEGLRPYLGKDIFYKVRNVSTMAVLAAGFLLLHHAQKGQFPLQLLEKYHFWCLYPILSQNERRRGRVGGGKYRPNGSQSSEKILQAFPEQITDSDLWPCLCIRINISIQESLL